jgi:hypothetical protein
MLTNISKLCLMWNTWGFDKKAAIHGIILFRLGSCNARGNGNKASKRAAKIETNAWFDHHARLTEADVDRMASLLEDKR